MAKKANATLVAHVDTARVPEEAVRAIPAPQFTPTWRPYSFNDLLDCFYKAAGQLELKVTRTDYSINKRETRLFGVWEIADQGDEDINLAMGFRTSVDKKFANGLCAGERVFVCDNLVFDSEFVLFRKHTGRLELEEIVMLAEEAMRGVLARFDELAAWHSSLKDTKLADREAALLTVAALRKELIPPLKLPEFHELYYGLNTKYSRDLWGWHGAVTELYNDLNLHTVAKKNGRLNKFMRYEVPQLIDPKKERVDFVGIEKASNAADERDRGKQREEARAKSKQMRKEARKAVRAARRKEKKVVHKEEIPDAVKAKVGATYTTKSGVKLHTVQASKKAAPKKKVVSVGKPKGKQKIVKCPACGAMVEKAKTCGACGEAL